MDYVHSLFYYIWETHNHLLNQTHTQLLTGYAISVYGKRCMHKQVAYPGPHNAVSILGQYIFYWGSAGLKSSVKRPMHQSRSIDPMFL